MVKHWVYVLECKQNKIYVGETKRLFRRLREHLHTRGAANTRLYKPQRLLGLYPIKDYSSNTQEKINHRDYENFITEIIILQKNLKENMDIDIINKNICGGKYLEDIKTKDFISQIQEDRIKKARNWPLCKCGIPCEIKQNPYHHYDYYRCSLHNVWPSFIRFFKNEVDPEFYIPKKPCDFYYKKDKKDN